MEAAQQGFGAAFETTLQSFHKWILKETIDFRNEHMQMSSSMKVMEQWDNRYGQTYDKRATPSYKRTSSISRMQQNYLDALSYGSLIYVDGRIGSMRFVMSAICDYFRKLRGIFSPQFLWASRLKGIQSVILILPTNSFIMLHFLAALHSQEEYANLPIFYSFEAIWTTRIDNLSLEDYPSINYPQPWFPHVFL